eukprot:gene19871-21813_t
MLGEYKICVCGLATFAIVLFSTVGCSRSRLPTKCRWNTRESLDCNDAGLRKIPDDIPRSTTRIDFSNNPLLKFEDSYFLRFHNLKILYLTNCLQIWPIMLPRTVKELYLELNNFKTESFVKMLKSNLSRSALNILYLDSNKLMLGNILPLLPKTSLTALSLGGNIIPVIEQHHFRQFVNLRRLHLSECDIKKIHSNSFDSLRSLRKLSLDGNNLKSLPNNLFMHLKKLKYLYLSRNKLDYPPVLQGSFQLTQLYLENNQIRRFSVKDLYKKRIFEIFIRHNRITSFNLTYMSFMGLDMSYNNITKLPDFAFKGKKYLLHLKLQNNSINYVSPNAFRGVLQIGNLYLHKNNIRDLPENVFKDMKITNLFLYGNQLNSMKGILSKMKFAPKLLLLFANPPLQMLDLMSYRTSLNHTEVFINCNTLKAITVEGDVHAKFRCFPSMHYSILTSDLSLSRDGYNCTRSEQNVLFRCTPCSLGYYTDTIGCSDGCCKGCPPGSFFQDELALTYCKQCPVGQYVPPERSPGKSPLECLTCPDGTLKRATAGYRACACLNEFARTYRFGKCTKCRQAGLSCKLHDYPILRSGHWWTWHDTSPSNLTCKQSFIDFMQNLDTKNDGYSRRTMRFTCQLPQAHPCPVKESCLGGINATCKTGYTGILCSVCDKGYSQQFQRCLKCPSKLVAVLQFIIYIVLFLLICAIVSWADQFENSDQDRRRTIADVILSNFKILIAFYQVLVATINAFSFVSWPRTFMNTVSFFKIIQFEVLRLPSLRCIKEEWHVDAIDEFWIALTVTAILPFAIAVYYLAKKTYLYVTVSFSEECKKRTFLCKSKCVRVLLLFLFVTYPSTSQRIANIVPLSCNKICTSMAENGHCAHELSYLRADHSVKCLSASSSSHNNFTLIIAYVSMLVIPVGLPVVLFVLLWKFAPKEDEKTRDQTGDEYLSTDEYMNRCETINNFDDDNLFIIADNRREIKEGCLQFAMKFLYENYTTCNRYWEPLEMLRKLFMTVGVTLLVGFGYYKIVLGLTIAIACLFAILHAKNHPMRNSFENNVQLLSLYIAVINICIGVILRSSVYKQYHQMSDDNMAVGVLFMVLNLIVFVVIFIRLAPIFYKVLKIIFKAVIGHCRKCTTFSCFIYKKRQRKDPNDFFTSNLLE